MTKNKRTSKRSYKNKTFRKKRSYKKGGSKEKCCICDKKIGDNKSFTPSECLMKHGKIRSHKICEDCWWNKFAKEGVSHKCPGCKKGLPLHGSPPPKMIDLTEDE